MPSCGPRERGRDRCIVAPVRHAAHPVTVRGYLAPALRPVGASWQGGVVLDMSGFHRFLWALQWRRPCAGRIRLAEF
jgi:hypothetical protein